MYIHMRLMSTHKNISDNAHTYEQTYANATLTIIYVKC